MACQVAAGEAESRTHPGARALAGARKVMAKGARCFPLPYDSKVTDLEEFFSVATSDSVALGQMFNEDMGSEWLTCNNAAVSTSHFGPNKFLLVLDIDEKGKGGLAALAALEKLHGQLPLTFVVKTPTGGLHLYMYTDEPVACSVDKISIGIDVRAYHGYVVAPGSTKGGKRYEIVTDEPIARAPAWLEALCERPRTKAEHAGEPIDGIDEERANRRAAEYLVTAPRSVKGSGGDATALAVANRVLDFGLTKEATLNLMMSEAWDGGCGWAPERLSKKIDNAAKYRQSPIGSAAPEMDYVTLTPPPNAIVPRSRKLYFDPFESITIDRDRDDLVKRVLSMGGASVTYGDSNTGKTFFILDLCMSIARGVAWRGRRVRQGAVVYVAAEGGDGIRKRIVAYREHHRLNGSTIPFYLVPCSVNLLDPHADTKELIGLIADAAATAKVTVVLVVIDTLARAMAGGNENASEDMGAFVSNIDAIRSATNAHVAVIHHSGKDTAKGSRGHSSLRAAIDTEIRVADHTAHVAKQRDSAMEPPMPFRLQVVNLGVDADGDPITSCVVVDAEPQPTARPTLPPAATRALELLKRLLVDEGCDQGGGFIAIPVTKWREAWRSEQPKTRTFKTSKVSTADKAFSRARTLLMSSGYIREVAGFIGLNP